MKYKIVNCKLRLRLHIELIPVFPVLKKQVVTVQVN